MQNNKIGYPTQIIHIQTNSKCILILMLKCESIKLLGKEIEVNICDLGLGNIFLYIISQSTNDLEKIDNWISLKFKRQRYHQESEKIMGKMRKKYLKIIYQIRNLCLEYIHKYFSMVFKLALLKTR